MLNVVGFLEISWFFLYVNISFHILGFFLNFVPSKVEIISEPMEK